MPYNKFIYHFQNFGNVKYLLISSEWSKYVDKGSVISDVQDTYSDHGGLNLVN